LAFDVRRSAAPEAELVQGFDQAGGAGRPKYGQLAVCCDQDETELFFLPDDLPAPREGIGATLRYSAS
jgi:hypothetical protein